MLDNENEKNIFSFHTNNKLFQVGKKPQNKAV